jgi:hypothetical protein
MSDDVTWGKGEKGKEKRGENVGGGDQPMSPRGKGEKGNRKEGKLHLK